MPFSSVRLVLFIDGLLVLVLAMAMAVPLCSDLITGNPDWLAFGGSIAVAGFSGGALALTCRGAPRKIDRRTGYLLTISAWLLVTFFGALPLMVSKLHLSLTDAVFETVSGLTTTGSTILVGLDKMPPGILLWRSILQWIGGVGVVAMAIVMFPLLRVGGMQLFRTESSDISEKMAPSVKQIAGAIGLVYLGLTVACAIGYAAAGMSLFDAVNHAMTTLATGGFSTKDASMGAFDSVSIEIVGIVFMTLGATPLVFYANLLLGRRSAVARERQIPLFLAIMFVAIALLAVWNAAFNGMPFWVALRQSAFNATSVLTDTGFATADFSTWGGFAVGIYFILFLIGGCAGSTAGAIKIFRWQVLFLGARRQLRVMFQPHRVLVTRYADQVVSDEMVASVRNFFFMYVITFALLSLAVMATGLDGLSSTSAVAQAMANAGPGLGPVVGPGTTFATIPDGAKWLLSAAMLLGRLELATVYVVFFADFWR
jgi:trk system potassium uptake protein TrkH